MGYGPIDYSGVDGEAARGFAIATGKVDLYPPFDFPPEGDSRPVARPVGRRQQVCVVGDCGEHMTVGIDDQPGSA